MNGIEYLNQIERQRRMIENKLVEIKQYREMAISMGGCSDGERVQSNGDKDKLGCAVAKIVDAERELEERIEATQKRRNHIIKQIEDMGDVDFYHVLFNRYVATKSFSEIAEDMNYSTRQVIRIHKNAIKEFEKLYLHKYLQKVVK